MLRESMFQSYQIPSTRGLKIPHRLPVRLNLFSQKIDQKKGYCTAIPRTRSGQPKLAIGSGRGQESAPFELLIAVILMGFVLFAGYQAIQRLHEQTCANTINSQLESMARYLENVASGRGSAQFQFSFRECSAKINDCTNFSGLASSTDIMCIKLIDSTDPNICSSFCSSARSICTLLQFKSRDNTITKCVDISPSTVFPAEGSLQCPSRVNEGWTLQDFTAETVQQGTYSFLKASDLTATVPIVCAYLRTG